MAYSTIAPSDVNPTYVRLVYSV